MAEDTQHLGKQRIIEELGQGGFTTVYRALDTTLERQVAIKVLDLLLMRDETWVERFHRQAKAVARLKHPHIVTIHEISEVEGRLYIAMELVEGSGDDTVRLWRVSDSSLLRTLEGHTSSVYSVAFSPDGATLASGSDDGTVRLWGVATD